jgi:DNA primase
VQAAGGVSGGRDGSGWLEAVRAEANEETRKLVSELAVEPLELPRRSSSQDDAEARYVRSVIAGVRLALVEAQVAELKSRLQRTNPMEDADAYHQIFGDLVPLEQYRIALREKALR